MHTDGARSQGDFAAPAARLPKVGHTTVLPAIPHPGPDVMAADIRADCGWAGSLFLRAAPDDAVKSGPSCLGRYFHAYAATRIAIGGDHIDGGLLGTFGRFHRHLFPPDAGRLEQEPHPALCLVDPHLDEARRSDVVLVVANAVSFAQARNDLLVVIT